MHFALQFIIATRQVLPAMPSYSNCNTTRVVIYDLMLRVCSKFCIFCILSACCTPIYVLSVVLRANSRNIRVSCQSIQCMHCALPNADALCLQACHTLLLMLLCWQLQEFKGQQLKQLVHALCPAIYGHELVKAGVLLCLFGGVRKGSEDQASAPVRGDVHCLLVGDPGIGKSQLLKVPFLSASPFAGQGA